MHPTLRSPRLAAALLAALLCVLSLPALADETATLFRSLLCMDKTGDANDFAERASIISSTRLRKSGGLYRGMIKLGKADYEMLVRNAEDDGVLLEFSVSEAPGRWLTNANVMRTFDDVLRAAVGEPAADYMTNGGRVQPMPRSKGRLNVRKIGGLQERFIAVYRNAKENVCCSIDGRNTSAGGEIRLTIKYRGAPLDPAAESAPAAAPEGREIAVTFRHGEERHFLPWHTDEKEIVRRFAVRGGGIPTQKHTFAEGKLPEGQTSSKLFDVTFRNDAAFFGAVVNDVKLVANEDGLYYAELTLVFEHGDFQQTLAELTAEYGTPELDIRPMKVGPSRGENYAVFSYIWKDEQGHALRAFGEYRDAHDRTLHSKVVTVTIAEQA